MKIIEVIVAVDGSTVVETKGFTGHECQKASRFLEAAIGERVGELLKPEFHQQLPQQQVNQQRR